MYTAGVPEMVLSEVSAALAVLAANGKIHEHIILVHVYR